MLTIRTQYQYVPSGTGSIPPSRDPKQPQQAGVGPQQAPPSQVGVAGTGQPAQTLPATSVPQPSVPGSAGTAGTALGVAGGSVASGQSQQAQSVQPSAQSVPDSKTYLESASRDSHPIPRHVNMFRLSIKSSSGGSRYRSVKLTFHSMLRGI